MTILDLDQLATVTGGTCGGQQAADPSQQQQQAQDPSAGAAGAGAGGLMAGIDQLLQLFQSPNFQQMIGGLRQLLGQIGGQQGGDPSAAQQQAAPQAGGQ